LTPGARSRLAFLALVAAIAGGVLLGRSHWLAGAILVTFAIVAAIGLHER
jgi:membrane-associated PAP2 superfamily phosphatase